MQGNRRRTTDTVLLGEGDGTGSAVRFDSSEGLALDDAGNLYIADECGATIRKLVLAMGGGGHSPRSRLQRRCKR